MTEVADAEPAARRGGSRLDWSGKFAEPALDRAFRQDELETLRRFLSFSVGLASLTFLAFSVHDALVVPEVRDRAWAVRFGVFGPASAIAFWLINSKHLLRFGHSEITHLPCCVVDE